MDQDQLLQANAPARAISDRAAGALAYSIYEQLRNEGCNTGDIISVSSQLISLLTSGMRKDT